MYENKTDFLQGLKNVIGENNSDEALNVLEYVNRMDFNNADKITELETKITELETEKTNLDNEWREKYKNTFFNPQSKPNGDLKKHDKPPKKDFITYDDLFK